MTCFTHFTEECASLVRRWIGLVFFDSFLYIKLHCGITTWPPAMFWPTDLYGSRSRTYSNMYINMCTVELNHPRVVHLCIAGSAGPVDVRTESIWSYFRAHTIYSICAPRCKTSSYARALLAPRHPRCHHISNRANLIGFVWCAVHRVMFAVCDSHSVPIHFFFFNTSRVARARNPFVRPSLTGRGAPSKYRTVNIYSCVIPHRCASPPLIQQMIEICIGIVGILLRARSAMNIFFIVCALCVKYKNRQGIRVVSRKPIFQAHIRLESEFEFHQHMEVKHTLCLYTHL